MYYIYVENYDLVQLALRSWYSINSRDAKVQVASRPGIHAIRSDASGLALLSHVYLGSSWF
jgi:hypothetical protein